MYNIANPQTTRTKSTGFVIPSNNEWVKAAYYDPKGGGTDSYWAYPTGPFDQPTLAVLNPTSGDVENRPTSLWPPTTRTTPNSSVDTPARLREQARTWCPYQAGSNCDNLPADFPTALDSRRTTRRT